MISTYYQWLTRAAILLLVVTVLTIGLIASGVLDPSPRGVLQWRMQEEQVSVPSQSREITWLQKEVPDSTITVRMIGALHSGDEDSGYGLVLGDEESYLAVTVSPLGYLAIWESDHQNGETKDAYLLQWQTWPHVEMEQKPNEIWIDITGDLASVRINREWLWEGNINRRSRHIGLLGESFADAAVIDFTNVELFAER
jgi:hypothetical protein